MFQNLYRYEIKEKNIGFLAGLDDIINEDEIFPLVFYFETCLEGPNIDMENTKSYFTSIGNRKFSKAIRNIKKVLLEKGYTVSCTCVSIDEIKSKIVYSDKYQIVVKG